MSHSEQSPTRTRNGPRIFHRIRYSLSRPEHLNFNKDVHNGTQEPVLEQTAEIDVQGEDIDAFGKNSPEGHDRDQSKGTSVTGQVEEGTSSGRVPHTAHHYEERASSHDKQEESVLKLSKSLASSGKSSRMKEIPLQLALTLLLVKTASAETSAIDAVVTTGQTSQDELKFGAIDEEYNDPASLASIIRNLIGSLPRPTEPTPVPSQPKLPQLDNTGRPILPPEAVRIDDKNLIAKLRNPIVMNGSPTVPAEGEEKPTVFAVLDSFKAPLDDPSQKNKNGTNNEGDETNGDSDVDQEPPQIITDDSSVMLYIPLVPTKSSRVEMAKCDIVPVTSGEAVVRARMEPDPDRGRFIEMLGTYRVYSTYGRGAIPSPVVDHEEVDDERTDRDQAAALPRVSWKFWSRKKRSTSSQRPAETSVLGTKAPDGNEKMPEGGVHGKPQGSNETHPDDDKGKKLEDVKVPSDEKKPTDNQAAAGDTKPTEGNPKEKEPHKLKKPRPVFDQRVWIPSNTHVSIQALWWGYRIFLPPPVMSVLSDKTIEAAKRAALITTALTWTFAHLPMDMVPAPMQSALLMLQLLVPYLGYMGTFISWSWSTIKDYDVGYGTILSATWVMPVALIPGTWQAYDFPGSTKAPGPVPGAGAGTGTPANQVPPAGTTAPHHVPPLSEHPALASSVPNASLDPTVTISPTEGEAPGTSPPLRLEGRAAPSEGGDKNEAEEGEEEGSAEAPAKTGARYGGVWKYFTGSG
ncbi:hypothetical protein AAF712_007751 [Marasmius tenuissimus]|uniref:Uncharacterized protein n=1 Tax=Marasmius tenuissimus TaxID=585030 RepID=A0ABR2ZVB4_9AGAR